MRKMKILLLIVLAIVLSECRAKPTVPVTHEDIRDVILILVRVLSATEDKLRRHELRERSLGDVMRKMIHNIDKRIKTLDPVMGTAIRLDERITDVEKTLLTNDIKDNNQMEEIKNLLVDIKTSFPVLIEKVKADILLEIKSNEKVTVKTLPVKGSSEETSEANSVEENTSISDKINVLSSSIQQIQDELSRLKNEQQNTHELNNKFSGYIDKFQLLLTNNEDLLRKFESKFVEDEVPPQDDTQLGWQASIMQALERTENDVEGVLEEVKHSNTKTVDLIHHLEKKIATSENTIKETIAEERKLISEVVILNSKDLDIKIEIMNVSIEDIKDKLSQIDCDKSIKKLHVHLNNSQSLLEEYKAKLSEYSSKLTPLTQSIATEMKNDQCTKILQVLEKQKTDFQAIQDDIKTKLSHSKSSTSQKNNSSNDVEKQILELLQNLEASIEDNTDSSMKLLERIENIINNEEQMLNFSRKSSQEVMDAVETISINMDVSFTMLKDEIQALTK